jgi:hypothetical protein
VMAERMWRDSVRSHRRRDGGDRPGLGSGAPAAAQHSRCHARGLQRRRPARPAPRARCRSCHRHDAARSVRAVEARARSEGDRRVARAPRRRAPSFAIDRMDGRDHRRHDPHRSLAALCRAGQSRGVRADRSATCKRRRRARGHPTGRSRRWRPSSRPGWRKSPTMSTGG